MTELRARLARETDAAALAAYRVAFGLMMTVSALRFLFYGWVDELFVRPKFFFKYWGLAWVPVPSAPVVHALFWALAAAGLFIALGLFYRVAMATFFVLFAWVFTMDVTNYLNHYYLVALLAALMLTMPLGRTWGLDGVLFGARRTTLPFWCTAVLRFQVAIVYLFAAVAKATPDWLLHAEPLSIWLAARTGLPILGPLFALPGAAYVMSWSGFLYDATIWAFLAHPRTRRVAYGAVLAFHAMTSALFPIGMFPVIMAVTALVFFDPSWPRALLARVTRRPRVAPAPDPSPRRLGRAPAAALAAYVILQLLVPLRGFAYGGNVLWHEQGMRFSWRVMCREKNSAVTYWVEDRVTHRTWVATPHAYLTDRQLREFGTQPDLVLQLAHHVAADYRARTGHAVAVRAEVQSSLNGRPAALLLDDARDLEAIDDGLAPADFIRPTPATAPAIVEPVHG
jgi:hypothetical protein